MTIKEVEIFADMKTTSMHRMELELVDGKKVVGYFDGNSDMSQRNNNEWNFVITPHSPDQKNPTKFHGDEILSITLLQVR